MKNASRNQKFGWLVMPISWAKVTGLRGLVALFCFCLSVGSVSAQAVNKEFTSISAQQRVPADFWTIEHQLFSYPNLQTSNLEAYRGKPLIVAFWSTTCGVCFVRYPLLKEMLSKYPNTFNVLLVNSMERDSMDMILNRFSKLDESIRFPSIVQDHYMKGLFPHGPLPFYVWIDEKGKVDAITSQAFITEENILRFLN